MKNSRIIIILGIVTVILIALMIPALKRPKIGGGPPCITCLKTIQLAKMMYAQDSKLTNDVSITEAQRLPYLGLGSKLPRCPAGGHYSIGTLHQSPQCSYPQHSQLGVLIELK